MNIRTRPLVIATVSGLIPLVLFNIVTSVLTFMMLPNMMGSIDPMNGPDQGYFQYMSLFSVLGCAGSIMTLVIYGLVGFGYTYFYRREADITPEEGAVGGALSAGLVAFTIGLLGAVVSLVTTPMIFNSMFEAMPAPAVPEMQDMMGVTTIFMGIGSAVSVCFSALFAALIGALGGVIGGAIGGKRAE